MIPCVDRAQLGHCYLRPPRQLWSGGQCGCSHPSYTSKMPDPQGWELLWAGVDSGKVCQEYPCMGCTWGLVFPKCSSYIGEGGAQEKIVQETQVKDTGFLHLSLRSFKHTSRNVLVAQQVAKSSQHSRGEGNQYHLTIGGSVHFF